MLCCAASYVSSKHRLDAFRTSTAVLTTLVTSWINHSGVSVVMVVYFEFFLFNF
jgi:uncharacterized protein YqgC (DUF456 family)